METLDLLEEYLMNYPGTVLMVSHDREFLNNVVTGILAFEGEGIIKEYVGGYDDWLRQSKAGKTPEPEKQTQKQEQNKPQADRPRRLTFKEKKELEGLPALIEKLEGQQKQLHELMADPEFYKRGSEIVTQTNRLKEIDGQLENAYARWQELEELP
jgi:ATP-binding cassette subfamily F protein uup